ncbi:DUF6503 family protein [Marinoscillum furvescens]|uniref:Deoxyribose-phosphate aldolase n=1 Tax=Marinoscillum furvescens DSM 4134 TaxID=1122208 RepID=A0A3D9L8G7_MARFU|nr:DUF6503 family protein [Marinoscillum furvescens]REE01576.1 hypothetical protein C7460_10392 [Marinoscillum furvescens DSM 4134]
MQKFLILLTMLVTLSFCSKKENTSASLIQRSIEAHGLQLLENKEIAFTFRDNRYTAKRQGGTYTYTRSSTDSTGTSTTDVLINSTDFYRIVNGDTTAVADSLARKYANSVNSVLYFVQLPYLLQEPAVNTTYAGKDTLNNEIYHVVQVTFTPEGGGEDHDDKYCYWFHSKTSHLDYLAYSYDTDGGGVRFREAYNRREISGITFQDYVNYKAPKNTPLDQLPALFSKGKLQKVSLIENTEIEVTN